jgi:hypothetical protein
MVRAFAAIRSRQQAYSQKVLYSPSPGRIQEYGATHGLYIALWYENKKPATSGGASYRLLDTGWHRRFSPRKKCAAHLLDSGTSGLAIGQVSSANIKQTNGALTVGKTIQDAAAQAGIISCRYHIPGLS